MNFLIALVTYNSADHVEECLNSLLATAASDGQEIRIVVADNSPDTATLDALAAYAAAHPQAPLHFRATGLNTGWARGSNLAVEYGLDVFGGSPDVLLLFNADARLEAGSLTAIADAFSRYPNAGLVGGRFHHVEDGSYDAAFQPDWGVADILLQFTGLRLLRFARLQKRLAPITEPAIVSGAAVSGAAMAIRWNVFEEVGRLDERYFLYSDDIDATRTITTAGYDVIYAPDMVVEHEGAASSRTLDADEVRSEVWKQKHMIESAARYVDKWYSPRLAGFVRWYEPRVTWRARLLRSYFSRDSAITPAVARSMIDSVSRRVEN